ncbi:MFS transporter [Catenulispora sp. GP43]|uniref:MFS transporter n=1 Tax=Catenulispora sp. GP43 TaxID=3156263 RepID=UPI0035170B78
MTTVALPLTALAAAHASSFEVGAVTAAGYVAWAVLGLPAGVLVGRLPLRGTQIAMDLVRAAALASVPAAWWLGSVTVAQLVVVALVVGSASVVFDVGNATMLPFLVSWAELTARNSLTSGAEAVTNLAGPSLGGALVQAVGAAAAIVVDVVSYLISAFLLRNVPRPPRAVTGTARTGIRASIREGRHYLIHEPVQRANLWIATSMNFVCGALMALTPLFLVRTLGLGAAWVGAMMAAEGLGSLIGASLTPRLTRRIGTGRARTARGGVRAGERRLRRDGGGGEHRHAHLPADRDADRVAAPGDGHGAGGLLGRDPGRGAGRRHGRDLVRAARGAVVGRGGDAGGADRGADQSDPRAAGHR